MTVHKTETCGNYCCASGCGCECGCGCCCCRSSSSSSSSSSRRRRRRRRRRRFCRRRRRRRRPCRRSTADIGDVGFGILPCCQVLGFPAPRTSYFSVHAKKKEAVIRLKLRQ